MLSSIMQFIYSAFVIVIAGTFLVKSSDSIGESLKIGRLFVGSILIAGATSLPELLVDISALRQGMPDLAVGDLLGSSLMNLLILAVADLLHKNPNKMFSSASVQHALSSAISLNLTVITAIFIFIGPRVKNLGIGEFGIGPILIAITYLFNLRLIYYSRSNENVFRDRIEKKRQELLKAILIYLASGIAIYLAAPYLAEAAGQIAEKSGLGKTFVGTSLVAFCTSLPELVSTLIAVRMGAFDLAVGNIFGSNAFNMVLLIPLDYVYKGSLLAAVSRSHVLTALCILLATSIVTIGQLNQQEKRIKFIEPDAFSVIAVVLAALFLLYLF